MSGSTAEVLLRARLTTEQITQLEGFVRCSAGSEDWQRFWLLGQPFTMELREPDEDEARFDLPGWSPAQVLLVCCHCRGPAGDLLLAFAVARIAAMFSGLIAFGAKLEQYTSNPSVLTFDGIEGRYRSEFFGDVLTPALLTHWAGCPEFRMVN